LGQQLIDERFDEIEAKLSQRTQRQDDAILTSARENREAVAALETIILQQSREIVALSRMIEPIKEAQEKRDAQDKKISALMRGRRA
jgi:hypothetical protein